MTQNRISTIEISTTSGSQEAAIVWCTPAERASLIRSSAYTPPTISTSGVSRYSSMATHRATISAVRRSSPQGEQGMSGHEHIWPETHSWRNTAMGAEGAIVARAKGLILLYTIFDKPLPGPVALNTQVHHVWVEALNHISDAGNIEASEESVKLVSTHQPIVEESFRHLDYYYPCQICQKHSRVRSQFIYHLKHEIGKLYDLLKDPTAIERRVVYLLETDRFMSSPRGYDVLFCSY